ncbi:hypothetical protein L6452_16395 [Arctium lappa]|uniref:Uncharacterized protein n=1 Tax=Arctium lappa TaxID=4217 RepID=A0ACB9C0M5_ARCLA|nr:hypothetical protein L6452_16395 [Arctium lappa]
MLEVKKGSSQIRYSCWSYRSIVAWSSLERWSATVDNGVSSIQLLVNIHSIQTSMGSCWFFFVEEGNNDLPERTLEQEKRDSFDPNQLAHHPPPLITTNYLHKSVGSVHEEVKMEIEDVDGGVKTQGSGDEDVGGGGGMIE